MTIASISSSNYTSACARVNVRKISAPCGLVDMVIPYEGSDYESDTDYVASVSSSFSDVTGPELVANSYDLIENQVRQG